MARVDASSGSHPSCLSHPEMNSTKTSIDRASSPPSSDCHPLLATISNRSRNCRCSFGSHSRRQVILSSSVVDPASWSSLSAVT